MASAAAAAAVGVSALEASPPAASSAAALAALALAEIAAPPLRDTDALTEAATLAFCEVERAAAALGLPPALANAVCRAVERDTESPASCHRLLGMRYRRLRAAATAGEVAVAREWMEEMAARGG